MAITGTTDLGNEKLAITVDHDPTSVATDAPVGSIIIDSSGNLYRKTDNGSSTNVELIVEDDDSRLTDARVPLSHASSHSDGGTDEITIHDLGSAALPSGTMFQADGAGAVYIIDFDTAVSANPDVVNNTADSHTHANKAQLDLVTDGDHDVRTDNPHATDFSNLGSGTLADINAIITDATLDDSSDPRTPTAHAASHSDGASDEITVQNLGSASAASGDSLIADGVGGLLFDTVSGGGGAHASTHTSIGSDTINGDLLDITFNPSGYTPDSSIPEASGIDDLSAHLAGISNALDGLTGGLSRFFPVNGNDNIGNYATDIIASNAAEYFSGRAPTMAATISRVAVICIPMATATGLDIDIHVDYASLGEDKSIHTASDTSSTYNFTADTITELDISSLFGSLSAGDYIGVQVDHNGIGQSVHYLGLVVEFSV